MAREPVITEPLCWFRLGPADRPRVAPGERVRIGDALYEEVRDVHLVTAPAATTEPATAGDSPDLEPGDPVDAEQLAAMISRGRGRAIDRGTFLFRGPDGRPRLAVGHAAGPVEAVVEGVVESVDGRGIAIRADGDGLPGAVRWGRSVRGPLLLGVSAPDEDLRASAIDAAAAGTILLAGARVDIEAITRARALGVRGIICGGILGKELRQLESSEARQRVSLHPVAPFAVISLDGYGRRPIPGPAWDRLSASASAEVSIVADPPMVLLAAGSPSRTSDDLVRVAAGSDLGRQGRLLDLRGQVRGPGGVYAPAGLVSLDGRRPGDPVQRRVLPLADLERLD